jgi:hypothetical protein
MFYANCFNNQFHFTWLDQVFKLLKNFNITYALFLVSVTNQNLYSLFTHTNFLLFV